MKKPVEILKHFQISFVTHHHSISKSCVGIDCPYCNDSNKHLGIFKEHGNFSCFKCGKRGSLYFLIKTLKGISYPEYQRAAGIQEIEDSVEQTLHNIFNPKKEQRKMESKVSTLISVTCDGMPENVKYLIDRFLVERKFTYNMLIRCECKYGISGFQAYRLVVPIYHDGNQIAQIGRDLTGTSEIKYKIDPPGIELSKCLYYAGDGLPVLVEGIFDAWAVAQCGGFGIAMFGSNLSDSQLAHLHSFDRILYMPDSDVPASKVLKTTDKLQRVIPSVAIWQCKTGDPCSMNREDLKKIIQSKS